MYHYGIPIFIFLSSYWIMFLKSNPFRLKYTFYVYFETICLVPFISQFPFSYTICKINTFGLGVGITSFYIFTNYKVLIEFGKAYSKKLNWKKEPSFLFLLFVDFIYHWVPYLLFLSKNKIYTNKKIILFTGFMTGLCHSTYYKLANGIWDPRKGYEVEHIKVDPWQITMSWVFVFLGHIVGAILCF